MHKALLIPWDDSKPVEEIELDENRLLEQMAAQVCAVRNGMLDFKSFPTQHTQLVYDDNGMFDQRTNTNIRAMKLWAHLAGVPVTSFRQRLVGNFIVLGMDPFEGDTLDVTAAVRFYFGEEGVPQS